MGVSFLDLFSNQVCPFFLKIPQDFSDWRYCSTIKAKSDKCSLHTLLVTLMLYSQVAIPSLIWRSVS